MENEKKRVTGLGGVFFKSQNPAALREWYQKHLGISMDTYGTSFEWREATQPEKKGFTAWSPFKADTDYFEPSPREFMLNYRVEDLVWLLEVLKGEGVTVLGEIQQYEYGKFAHIIDVEGNKVELWEANDEAYDQMIEARTL